MPQRLTTEEFIERANKVHNFHFDYSKVEYVNSQTKVIVICKKHGEFTIRPNNHLGNKNGCPYCAGLYKTTEDYIKEANEVHNNFYDYSKTIYSGPYEKITIICPKHGEFRQTASSHIGQKCGCPTCGGRNLKFIPYNEVKKIIKKHKIKNKDEYDAWWNKNRDWCVEKGIPRNPYYTYK
ncbi:MAG: DUF723 domain-containing protein [bacterium]